MKKKKPTYQELMAERTKLRKRVQELRKQLKFYEKEHSMMMDEGKYKW